MIVGKTRPYNQVIGGSPTSTLHFTAYPRFMKCCRDTPRAVSLGGLIDRRVYFINLQSAVLAAKNVRIFGWVGAGRLDCWFLAMIVGKTRPYNRHAIIRADRTMKQAEKQ